MARAKIALLYVGGSIGMQVNQKTGRIEPIESLNEIHRFLPELQREVALQFFSIANVGSSDVTPEHWIDIANAVQELYDKFDGFVVVHGTNTMAYTAAALSFALQSLSKPVVMTGALMPINDIAGDGRMNLIFAIRAAQLDIAEVCVTLGPRVLRGCRIKKVDQSMLQTFDTPKIRALADFSVEVSMSPDRFVRRKRTLECRPTFDTDIAVITAHPGVHQKFLDAIADSNPHGVILRAYGPGMLSDMYFPWLRTLSKKEIPVVITSQALRSKIDLHRFRKQLTMEHLGIISGKDMTLECATVKLMWALTQAKTPLRLRELMERSLAGELEE